MITFKIFQIYKPEKTVFNVFTVQFNSTKEMVDYCLEMDNDVYYYYGAATH